MIDNRRAASAAAPSQNTPSSSGPRCTSRPLIRATTSMSGAPSAETRPQIPHMAGSLAGVAEVEVALYRSPQVPDATSPWERLPRVLPWLVDLAPLDPRSLAILHRVDER